MCGIIGLYSKKNTSSAAHTQFTAALNTLNKRGPDSQQQVAVGNHILGHARLSIIDTSAGAHQPFTSACGNYVIVFNGEIYNYQDLYSSKLKHLVPQLRTTSDTEVLINLLIHYGAECLPWLHGFFAFAFLQKDKNQLLLARDRYGKKPLIYAHTQEHLLFASEMKALVELGVNTSINYNAFYHYLQLNYIPQPASIYEGCTKLAPGHYMQVLGPNATIHKYYSIACTTQHYAMQYADACKKLHELMDKAVQKRLIADVPLGAFLSGGIDSSVVVALASQHVKGLNTFSIGYADYPLYDETAYAHLVAKKYNTNHTTFSLRNADVHEHIHNILAYLDEPFADPSCIPSYILCMHTKQHATVALSGDGGDEVFSGYNKHAAEWRIRQGGVLNTLLKHSHGVVKHLPQSRASKAGNTMRKLAKYVQALQASQQDRYWQLACFNNSSVVNGLLQPHILKKINEAELLHTQQRFTKELGGTNFNEVLKADMQLVLAGDMLHKVDMMSMANSLEVRSPFLDHEVVDFAFGLPVHFKIDKQLKKKIVQETFKPLLPPELFNRPKRGFEIPLNDFFKTELWSTINDDLLGSELIKAQNIFNPSAIENIKLQLKHGGKQDVSWLVWNLVVFQSWWKKQNLA